MRRLIATAFCVFFSAQAVADVTVYRQVDRRNGTYAKINNDQWRIDTDGMSTFEDPPFDTKATTKPCKVEFVIEGVGSQPQFPDPTSGQIANMAAGTTGTYTPAGGAGHWSLNGPNNNIGFAEAITSYVTANKVASVNDAYTGKSKSKCLTPTTANVAQRTTEKTPRPRHRKTRRHRSHRRR